MRFRSDLVNVSILSNHFTALGSLAPTLLVILSPETVQLRVCESRASALNALAGAHAMLRSSSMKAPEDACAPHHPATPFL